MHMPQAKCKEVKDKQIKNRTFLSSRLRNFRERRRTTMDTKLFRIGGVSAIIVTVGVIPLIVLAGPLGNPATPAEQVLQMVAAAPQRALLSGLWELLLDIGSLPLWLALYFALREREHTYALLGMTGFVGHTVPLVLNASRLPGLTFRLAQIYSTGGAAEKTAALVVMQSVSEWTNTGAYVVGGLTVGAGALFFGLAMLNSRWFPRWLGWLGVATGVLHLIGGLFLLFLPALVFLILAGTFPGLVWSVISGIYLLRIKAAT
jgi:hypothetical protein